MRAPLVRQLQAPQLEPPTFGAPQTRAVDVALRDTMARELGVWW
jgi:hypothetical protein